jgi:hypothetical protein
MFISNRIALYRTSELMRRPYSDKQPDNPLHFFSSWRPLLYTNKLPSATAAFQAPKAGAGHAMDNMPSAYTILDHNNNSVLFTRQELTSAHTKHGKASWTHVVMFVELHRWFPGVYVSCYGSVQ